MVQSTQSQTEKKALQAAATEPVAVSADAKQLTLVELTRIMDVATTLRKERIKVQKEFNLPETKKLLREKLLETAKVTGEPITEAEIDAAIRNYFDNLHTFESPKLSPRVLLAHLYVRRGIIFRFLTAIALAVGFFFAWNGISAARQSLKAENLWLEVSHNSEAVQSIADDPALLERFAEQEKLAALSRDNWEFDKLEALVAESNLLRAQVEAEYEIVVVHEAGQQSAVDRMFTDAQGERVSGYYLIVEARGPDGSKQEIEIENRETGKKQLASRWAEQVSKEVYDRLAADKQADGVLDEILFARKTRGKLKAATVMHDVAGNPVTRQGQITQW